MWKHVCLFCFFIEVKFIGFMFCFVIITSSSKMLEYLDEKTNIFFEFLKKKKKTWIQIVIRVFYVTVRVNTRSLRIWKATRGHTMTAPRWAVISASRQSWNGTEPTAASLDTASTQVCYSCHSSHTKGTCPRTSMKNINISNEVGFFYQDKSIFRGDNKVLRGLIYRQARRILILMSRPAQSTCLHCSHWSFAYYNRTVANTGL